MHNNNPQRKYLPITITGTGGLLISITYHGAKILSHLVPTREGEKVDILLGCSGVL